MINIITWIAVILQAVGSTAIVFKKRYAFPVWAVSAVILIYVNIMLQSHAQVCLWCFFLVLDFYGWFKWGKK